VSQWLDAPSFENAQLFWRYADNLTGNEFLEELSYATMDSVDGQLKLGNLWAVQNQQF
jgi:hypothetical protein